PPRSPRSTLFPYTTLFRSQVLQDLQLACGDALLRAEDDSFLFFQLRRDVALAARKRLLAQVVVRQSHPVGVADLDVVAEDLVERSEENTSELQSPYDLVCR